MIFFKEEKMHYIPFLLFSTIFSLITFSTTVSAQYNDISGNNPYIQQYLEADENNWNKSIIYVFYNNSSCGACAAAMGMIYNIYEQNYSGQYSYFEINYADPGEFNFQIEYNLTQPLSVVLVRINDGMARGYYKIDNPQDWVADPSYFTQNLTSQINNFFN